MLSSADQDQQSNLIRSMIWILYNTTICSRLSREGKVESGSGQTQTSNSRDSFKKYSDVVKGYEVTKKPLEVT